MIFFENKALMIVLRRLSLSERKKLQLYVWLYIVKQYLGFRMPLKYIENIILMRP